MEMKTLEKDTRDIARGTVTNFLGVLARSLNLIFYIFLSQVYGAQIVGIFVISRSYVDIISKLGILGLDRGILTQAARHKARGDEATLYRTVAQALWIGLVATSVVIVLLEVGIIPLMSRFYHRLDIVIPLRIMGLGMLFWTISAILMFATRALRIMKYEVIVKNVIEPSSILLFAVPFFFLGWGITGLSVAFLLSVVCGTGAAVYFFARKFNWKRILRSLFSKEERGKLFRFSLPIGIYDMLNLLLQRIDLFILGYYSLSTTVGVYSIAQNAAFTFRKVRQSFDPIVIPVLSASRQLRDRVALLKQYQNVTRWVLILNTGFFGLCFFGSRSIMRIFGGEFVAGATAMLVLTAAVIVNSIFGIAELFLLIDRPMINLFNTIGAVTAAVSLNLLFVPRWGLVGAAAAMLATYSLMNIVRMIEVWFLYALHPFTFNHLKVVIAAMPSLALVHGIKLLIVDTWTIAADLVSVVAFLACYLTFLFALGLAEEERALIGKRQRSRK